ncbi:MAG: TonB-dependent receptor [Saprospiraceae bacterium]|nr:TonB-dependent receptor [Saprospiraceae bacterium]
MKIRLLVFLIICCFSSTSLAQATLKGIVKANEEALAFANVMLRGTTYGGATDEFGHFEIQAPAGIYTLEIAMLGYQRFEQSVELKANQIIDLETIILEESASTLNEVVVTGTLKEVNRIESPVPVEVYNPTFFKKNPTPNIFDALQNVNGVRPQLNCNVCNTGDIHINGLEGPYTMVLIDGMPVVSSLATVYGLSGIPNSLVERIEIVKGPASSLYGSEAIGGLINIITKNPQKAPLFSADIMSTSWQEYNADLGLKFNISKKVSILTGANYFNYNNIIDNNKDHFTDVTLQNRVSVFQKWNIARKNNRLFTLAGRYFYEDRWGGDVKWTKEFRGGDEIYGESIYTKRWEFLGNYQLPTTEKLLFSFSYNDHDQNSVYGNTAYLARQRIGFGQLTWDKTAGHHDLLIGTALRYTFYDDNTPATGGAEDNPLNNPDKIWLPGVFVQDEIRLNPQHKVLLGLRYDYNSRHGNIFTPRFAYKWSISKNDILRLNAGTGFRVVNLFTEEHAALTGAREIIIKNELKPEQSYNINVNYIKKIYLDNGGFIGLDATAWYTYFTNVIFPDYETNANQIIYDNLNGRAITTGMSTNVDVSFANGLTLLAGATFMDVSSTENGIKERQMLTERFTGTWAISYKFPKSSFGIDYTGNIYGPMRLPLLGDLDPRQPNSPTWSIQNIQLTYNGIKNLEIYGGVKNLLNWTPNKGNPFIIARADDPFDKNVKFDTDGQVIATPDNPYALTFDPAYVYGPNQGIRGFLGMRLMIQ